MDMLKSKAGPFDPASREIGRKLHILSMNIESAIIPTVTLKME